MLKVLFYPLEQKMKMRPQKSWPKDLLWVCGGSEDFQYQMTEFNAMWLECQKECYFALKDEVLLTVITGTPKKDSAFVQTTHLSLISLDLALKRWAAHTFIDTLTFSFCSGFAKMLSSSFNEFHKREFCLLWNYIVPHDSKLCWSGFEFQSGDF